MLSEVRRLALFAVYQVAVALGILLMPVALAAGKAGVALPVDRVVDALGRAYDDASGRARPR